MAIKHGYVNGIIGLLWAVCASVGTSVAPAQTASEVVLHNFATSPPRGANPWAGVIRDAAGNLYGTCSQGGYGYAGVVYELETNGYLRAMYSFTGGADGGYPQAGVIADSGGNLYGTAGGGSAYRGVVYTVDPAGQEAVLYNFTGGADGGNPDAGVIRDSKGNLYGATVYGGTAGDGVVYRVDSAGHETVLYSFTGGVDGGSPYAGVIRDSTGKLYGTAAAGGKAGTGVVFRVEPQ